MTPQLPTESMSAVMVTVLLVTAVAAFTDAKSGRIPNWLTFPAILLPPIVLGLFHGVNGLALSASGLLVCFIVPFVLFRARAMAGGDVKLFAAIGALVGPEVGLEAQFYSMAAAAIIALGLQAKNGKLLATLRNTLFVALNPVLPKKRRRTIAREQMDEIRLGVPIFIGTLTALVLRVPALLSET